MPFINEGKVLKNSPVCSSVLGVSSRVDRFLMKKMFE
jgi:hypothetical protein